MTSESNDEQTQAQQRAAFIANMKRALEQAQANGQSPEQIRALTSTLAHAEMQRQMPQIIAKTRSWWSGLRNFLIVGALALGLSIGLALFVEHRYAAPLCTHYAALHELTYKGIEYPVIGRSSNTTSSGRCIFVNSAGQQNTLALSKVGGNWLIVLLLSFALQIDFTTPVAFILIALLAVALRKRNSGRRAVRPSL